MIETKLMRVGTRVKTKNEDNHYLTVLRKEYYTVDELSDIADTIKSYVQDLDLIEKLY